MQQDCSSDEFWINASGDLVAEGVFDFWTSAITLYRMTVQRGPRGEVLSYTPSLSREPVVFDWSWSGGLSDPFTPELTGGPTEENPTNNSWGLSTPYVQSGILTVQPAGSRSFTVFSFGTDVYAEIGYEVVWA